MVEGECPFAFDKFEGLVKAVPDVMGPDTVFGFDLDFENAPGIFFAVRERKFRMSRFDFQGNQRIWHVREL